MELAILTQSVKNQMLLIVSIRLAEIATRNAVSNTGIEQSIAELFPGVQDNFVRSNRFFPNVLQRGVNRYVGAVTRATLNWEWTGGGSAPMDGAPDVLLAGSRDLLQAATVDGLVSGKFAFFPYLDSSGVVRISALTGFLWPIFSGGNSNVVEALLQVTSQFVNGRYEFEVRRYSAGLLEVFGGLLDWRDYATSPSTQFMQPHARNRLPVVFRITGRDANRYPEGLASTAMPAWMDYVKARVLMSFNSELGSFEERVYNSDEIFKLARDQPTHPLLKQLREVGPRKAKFLPTADKYTRMNSTDLSGYAERAAEAAEAVDSAMNIPSAKGKGANLTGVALQELREAYTESLGSICNGLADALTEASELAAGLNPQLVRSGWTVSLTPKFTQDVDAERNAIRQDFQVDLILKSSALSGLQGLGVKYVTDAMVKRAQEEEAAEAPIVQDNAG